MSQIRTENLTAHGARLARAMSLSVQPLGGARFRVTGGSAPHVVHVHYGGRAWCDCPDFARREGAACKHVLAVGLLMAGDAQRAAVVHALESTTPNGRVR